MNSHLSRISFPPPLQKKRSDKKGLDLVKVIDVPFGGVDFLALLYPLPLSDPAIELELLSMKTMQLQTIVLLLMKEGCINEVCFWSLEYH